MSKTLINLPGVARNFPHTPKNEIKRDNIVSTMETLLSQELNVLIVEGEDGIGKTNLLSQFSRINNENTISIFIEPSNKYAYDLGYLAEVISEQVSWIINGKPLKDDEFNESYLSINMAKLQRKAKKIGNLYFVLDGLSEIPGNVEYQKRAILHDLLPLGLNEFKFIISGDSQELEEYFDPILKTKVLPLSAFSLDETAKYLGKIDLKRSEFQDIHRMCRGLPGHLEIVKRQLDSGNSIDSFTNAEPSKLPDFISIEWKRFEENLSENEKKALVLIAIKKNEFYKSELSDYGYIMTENIDEFLDKVSIIEEHDDRIKFISYPHRKFILDELNVYKDEIMEILITKLLKDLDSQTAVNELPDLLEDKGDLTQLVSILSPEYFKSALKYSKSLYYIYNRSDQGVKSAKKTQNLSELYKYSLQKSILYELLQRSTTKEELEARLIVEDFESALSLAQSSFTKEEKLHQLCILAKYFKKNNRVLNQEIIDQIKLLVEQVDIKIFREKGIDVASNLIWVDPDLALEVVEKISDLYEDDNALDFAFTKLSLEASEAKGNEPLYADVLEKTKSRISDPKLQNFIEAASSYTGELSANEIIQLIDPLETKTKVFILKQWLLQTNQSDDVESVIKYALDQLVSSSKYTPKIRDLREIIHPLHLVEDAVGMEELIGRIDSLVGTMRNLGTSVEYVRLQLKLAQCEVSIELNGSSINRCIELFFYINEIKDLITKTECLAWFYTYSDSLDSENILEREEGLISLLKEGLEDGFSNILKYSASQYIVCKGIFKALSINHLEYSLEKAKKLNTRERRDTAITDILVNVSKKEIKEVDLSLVETAINDLTHLKPRDNTILNVIKNFSNQKEISRRKVFKLRTFIELISNEERQSLCYAYYLKLVINNNNNSEYDELIEEVNKKISEKWQLIDCKWVKISVGYNISRILSESSKSRGLNFLDKVDEINSSKGINSYKSALVYITSIRLATRLCSGIVSNSKKRDSDLERIAEHIEKIPSSAERAGLWTDLAVRFYAAKDNNTGHTVVANYLLPTINGINNLSNSYKNSIISNSAPAIYFYHNNTLTELLTSLNDEYQEYAVDNICNFILKKTSLDDPYRAGPIESFEINHKDALDIISLLNHFKTDVYIYRYIDDLVTSISDKKNKRSFTRQQRTDLAFKMKEIVNQKLPDNNNIRHEGFKIASLATLNTLLRVEKNEWESLIEQAQEIANESDKAYVLAIIAKSIDEIRYRDLYTSLVSNIENVIENNESIIERMNRYYDVANLFAIKDKSTFRKNLQNALISCHKYQSEEVVEDKRKSIIDLAHSIDPHFASSLINLFDDDIARKKEKSKIDERLKFLNKKNQMGDRKILDLELDGDEYAEAAWMNLGALNAEKLETFHMENFYDHIEKSSKLGISYSFAILSWITENAIRRFSDTDQLENKLVKLFETSMICCDLAYYFDTVNKDSLSNMKSKVSNSDVYSSVLQVNEGERDKAVDYIRNWVKKSVDTYIKICDPYFSPQDLWLVKLIKEELPECKISILSGKKQIQSSSYKEEFRDYWKLNISQSEPPFVKYVVVSIGTSDETPIHDRWILSKQSGLKLGTSLNSLGIKKISEISVMDNAEIQEKQIILDGFLNMEKHIHNGDKLDYSVFNL